MASGKCPGSQNCESRYRRADSSEFSRWMQGACGGLGICLHLEASRGERFFSLATPSVAPTGRLVVG